MRVWVRGGWVRMDRLLLLGPGSGIPGVLRMRLTSLLLRHLQKT